MRALRHRNPTEETCPLLKFALCMSISGRRIDLQHSVRALLGNSRIAAGTSPENQFVRARDGLVTEEMTFVVTPSDLRVRADDIT